VKDHYSIPNHLDQAILVANQKQRAKVISYLLHSSLASIDWALVCILPASVTRAKMLGQNHFSDTNQHVLTSLQGN